MMFVIWTTIKEVPIQFCFIIQELEDEPSDAEQTSTLNKLQHCKYNIATFIGPL